MQACDGCYAARRSFDNSLQALKSGEFSQAATDLRDGMTAAIDVAVAKPLISAGLKFRDILKKIKD